MQIFFTDETFNVKKIVRDHDKQIRAVMAMITLTPYFTTLPLKAFKLQCEFACPGTFISHFIDFWSLEIIVYIFQGFREKM